MKTGTKTSKTVISGNQKSLRKIPKNNKNVAISL